MTTAILHKITLQQYQKSTLEASAMKVVFHCLSTGLTIHIRPESEAYITFVIFVRDKYDVCIWVLSVVTYLYFRRTVFVSVFLRKNGCLGVSTIHEEGGWDLSL